MYTLCLDGGNGNKEVIQFHFVMVSANTLFHFTGSSENVINILTNHFSPRYCVETIKYLSKTESIDVAIPMICFCDIPLSQISEHVDVYGEYAIGLTKEWAIRNGISPLLYLYYGANTMKFIPITYQTSMTVTKIESLVRKSYNLSNVKSVVHFMTHCKDYNGSMLRNGSIIDKVFYNENEWRFVPADVENIRPDLQLLMSKDKIVNIRDKEYLNQLLSSIKIEFTPNDIKYLVISKESERQNFISTIEKIKGGDYNENELKILNSKIISIENIKEDF